MNWRARNIAYRLIRLNSLASPESVIPNLSYFDEPSTFVLLHVQVEPFRLDHQDFRGQLFLLLRRLA
jgi:hypothetical protein